MVMERQLEKGGKANPAAFSIAEAGFGNRTDIDDDGRERRTGTLVTASAHIITAVIGSGVLSLAWAIAQLGWVIGPAVLLAFSVITWFCSSLLADCYRFPDPVHGKRNYTYGQAVRANLGVGKCRLCSLALYINLVGVTIGYTITTAISMGQRRGSCKAPTNREQVGAWGPMGKLRAPTQVVLALMAIVAIFSSAVVVAGRPPPPGSAAAVHDRSAPRWWIWELPTPSRSRSAAAVESRGGASSSSCTYNRNSGGPRCPPASAHRP